MDTCIADKLDGLVLVGGQYTMADAAMLAEYPPQPFQRSLPCGRAGLAFPPEFDLRDVARAL